MEHTIQILASGEGRKQGILVSSALSAEAMRQALEHAAGSSGEMPSVIIVDKRQELKDTLPLSLSELEAKQERFTLPSTDDLAGPPRNRAERRQRCRRRRH